MENKKSVITGDDCVLEKRIWHIDRGENTLADFSDFNEPESDTGAAGGYSDEWNGSYRIK